REVRLSVVGPARPVELLDLVTGPPVQHRPVADPACPLEQLVYVAVEPDDRAQLPQPFHPALAARQAAAGGDDVTRLECQCVERLGLELAESLLALVAEDLGDRAALARDDHVVSLDEAAPEPARQEPPADRLSGAHESNEHDVVGPHPRIVSDRGARLNATGGREALAMYGLVGGRPPVGAIAHAAPRALAELVVDACASAGRGQQRDRLDR